ncbi:cell wall hydrolase [Curvivirga aplysinae]|uniref:cell wall hydrolase n=1 Tax=Curvivirga aplysinae TaxID=2529852 RepID=UPI0012BB655D|nr:cell wall hydrolase [Curvivirga aplysinae]MTI10177.1 cell wall hydrolase [Curvivirga aplysinae]
MKTIRLIDVETLARTIWAEARGEGPDGMMAVACVILNRWRDPKWWSRDENDDIVDDTVEAVCRDPWQFSCWNKNDPNLPKLLAIDLSDQHFKAAFDIAYRCCFEDIIDLVEGSKHYHTKSISPDWAKGKFPVAHIGHHLFYNDIE